MNRLARTVNIAVEDAEVFGAKAALAYLVAYLAGYSGLTCPEAEDLYQRITQLTREDTDEDHD